MWASNCHIMKNFDQDNAGDLAYLLECTEHTRRALVRLATVVAPFDVYFSPWKWDFVIRLDVSAFELHIQQGAASHRQTFDKFWYHDSKCARLYLRLDGLMPDESTCCAGIEGCLLYRSGLSSVVWLWHGFFAKDVRRLGVFDHRCLHSIFKIRSHRLLWRTGSELRRFCWLLAS